MTEKEWINLIASEYHITKKEAKEIYSGMNETILSRKKERAERRKEKHNERSLKYYYDNQERLMSERREYRKTHPDQVRESQKKSYQKKKMEALIGVV